MMTFKTLLWKDPFYEEVELQGSYRPSTLDTGYPRGTPGETEGIDDMQVFLDGVDITDTLTAEQLDFLEDEFVEYARKVY